MAALLLDHNLSPQLAALLRRAGYAVTTAREAGLAEVDDRMLLQLAARTGPILVTTDRDFLDLHSAARHAHAGILVLPQFPNRRLDALVRLILDALASGLPNGNACYLWEEPEGWVRQP